MALGKSRIPGEMATRIPNPPEQDQVIPCNIQDWIKDVQWESAKPHNLGN